MKITVEVIEEKIRKTEEKLELLQSQLQVMKGQRMIDLTAMPKGFKKVPDKTVKSFSEHLKKCK